MSRPSLSGPLETAVNWVWALGTAAGFATVGLLVDAEHSAAPMPLAHPSLSAEDMPLADDAG